MTSIKITTGDTTRAFTFVDPGTDCTIITSEGEQTINGTKNFGTISADMANVSILGAKTGGDIELTAAAINAPNGFTLTTPGGTINIIPGNGVMNFGTTALYSNDVNATNRVNCASIGPMLETYVEFVSDVRMSGQNINLLGSITFNTLTGPLLLGVDASKNLTTLLYSTTNTGNAIVQRDSSGIITTASFRCPAAVADRKVVLWQSGSLNNDYQYFGFGVQDSTLAYNVDTTASSHVFYAGASTTTRNELVRIKGTGGIEFTNSTASYIPSTLSYYEKDAIVSINFTGAFTLNSLLFVFMRLGNFVLCRMPTIAATATSATTINAAAGSIPARFRPINQYRGLANGRDAGASQADPLAIDFLTTGGITINKNGASINFTSGSICGPWGTCFMWEC